MSFQNRRHIMVFALFALLAVCLVGWADRENDVANQQSVNAKSRRFAAMKVYEEAWKRRLQEPDRVGWDVQYDWSVRWLHADRDLSRTKVEEIAAFEEHLKRMETLKENLAKEVAQGVAATYEANGAEFFRLEAEDWLAKAKGKQ